MTRSEQILLVERLLESWNAHDPDAIAACYAPDAVTRDMTLHEPQHGRVAIRATARMYLRAFPDVRFTLVRLACDPEADLVCEEWQAVGTHRGDLMGVAPTGRSVEVSGCNVIRIDADGLISEETTYWDAHGVIRQLRAPDMGAITAV